MLDRANIRRAMSRVDKNISNNNIHKKTDVTDNAVAITYDFGKIMITNPVYVISLENRIKDLEKRLLVLETQLNRILKNNIK